MLVPFGPWATPFGAPFGASLGAEGPVSEADKAAATAAQVSAYLPLVSSAVSALTGGSDAVEDVGVIKAKIENMQRMKSKMPLLGWYFDNEINKLRAKLTAAQRRVSLQAETEESTREWRGIGKAALIVGIVLVGSIALYVVAGIFKPRRAAVVVRGTPVM